MPSTIRRIAWATAAPLAVAALLGTGSASAGTFETLTASSAGYNSDGHLVYIGTSGEDRVSIARNATATKILINDHHAITPGSGCSQGRHPAEIECDLPRTPHLMGSFWLLSGADFIGIHVPMQGTVYGGQGNDHFKNVTQSGHPIEFRGGTEDDIVDYSFMNGAVVVSLDDIANDGRGGRQDNVRSDVESVWGGIGNDTLIGNAGPNNLKGGPGADLLKGEDGPDVLSGAGTSLIEEPAARDSLYCGFGTDTAREDEGDFTHSCEN